MYDSNHMTIAQLLGFIYQQLNSTDLQDIEWSTIEIRTSISVEDGHQLIDSHFSYYGTNDQTRKHEFDPSDPISLMNAIQQLRERMAEKGTRWDTIKVLLRDNGKAELHPNVE